MDPTRIRAFKMRKAGKSYNEINRVLHIPKSTLSSWFHDMPLSESARVRLQARVHTGVLACLVKRNKAQTHKAQQRAQEIQLRAMTQVKEISKYHLLILGTVLYWAEGYKKLAVKNGKERTWHSISFTNTDPAMVRCFMRFLREVMEIQEQNISLNLRLFKHINEEHAIMYWSKVTHVSKDAFDKVSYVVSKSSQGKKPFNQLPYGTIQVRVNDTKKFHQLMGWIEGVKNQYVQDDITLE